MYLKHGMSFKRGNLCIEIYLCTYILLGVYWLHFPFHGPILDMLLVYSCVCCLFSLFLFCQKFFVHVYFCENFSTGDCVHGNVRLINGANANEGTLELCLYTQWGSISYDEFSYVHFSYNDAKVICRMLGYDVDSVGAGDSSV